MGYDKFVKKQLNFDLYIPTGQLSGIFFPKIHRYETHETGGNSVKPVHYFPCVLLQFLFCLSDMCACTILRENQKIQVAYMRKYSRRGYKIVLSTHNNKSNFVYSKLFLKQCNIDITVYWKSCFSCELWTYNFQQPKLNNSIK